MSVLIKGMEMPVIELDWAIRRGADGKWYAIDTNAETSDGEWHEIIPVPPHGELIDVGTVNLSDGPYEYQDWVEWAWEQYLNAPVFLPADPPKMDGGQH